MKHWNRRAVVSSLSVFPVAFAARAAWPSVDLSSYLLEPISGDDRLRLPARTGALTDAQQSVLMRMFRYIGTRWEMARTGVREGQLVELVSQKTNMAPSYLEEYRQGVQLLERCCEKVEGVQGIELALAPQMSVSNFELTRLGRFQRYVSNEFIQWYVIRGGFRRYGYADYRGFGGGPFTNSVSIPYYTIGVR